MLAKAQTCDTHDKQSSEIPLDHSDNVIMTDYFWNPFVSPFYATSSFNIITTDERVRIEAPMKKRTTLHSKFKAF